MTKGFKILLGLLSFLPLLYCGYFVWKCISLDFIYNDFRYLMIAHIAFMLLYLGLLVFYVIHIVRSGLQSDKKIMWLLVVLLLSMLGPLIYWYLQVWRSDDDWKSNEDPLLQE